MGKLCESCIYKLKSPKKQAEVCSNVRTKFTGVDIKQIALLRSKLQKKEHCKEYKNPKGTRSKPLREAEVRDHERVLDL